MRCPPAAGWRAAGVGCGLAAWLGTSMGGWLRPAWASVLAVPDPVPAARRLPTLLPQFYDVARTGVLPVLVSLCLLPCHTPLLLARGLARLQLRWRRAAVQAVCML